MTVRDWGVDLWRALSEPVARTANGLCLLVGLTGGVAALAPQFTSEQSTQSIIQSSALAAIALVALVVVAHKEITYAKRRRLANTLNEQQKASEIVRDCLTALDYLLRKKQDGNELSRSDLSKIRDMIAKVLDIYATIYTISSATKCRSCVKLIDEDDGSLFVFALARDEMSARENRHDDERRHRTRHDKLDDNSDFVSLFDPDTGDDGFFFADDVSKLKGYKSTSYSYRINVRSDPNQQPENDVPVLPYKSVLVWPIRQDKDESIGADTMRCVGFLAIDSEAPRAFQRRWDAPLGKVLANSLYPVLERYALIDRMLTNAEPSGALQVPAVPAAGLIGHERG